MLLPLSCGDEPGRHGGIVLGGSPILLDAGVRSSFCSVGRRGARLTFTFCAGWPWGAPGGLTFLAGGTRWAPGGLASCDRGTLRARVQPTPCGRTTSRVRDDPTPCCPASRLARIRSAWVGVGRWGLRRGREWGSSFQRPTDATCPPCPLSAPLPLSGPTRPTSAVLGRAGPGKPRGSRSPSWRHGTG
jgi:hypothetical protein